MMRACCWTDPMCTCQPMGMFLCFFLCKVAMNCVRMPQSLLFCRFEDEEEGAIAGEAEGGTGPICSTALAVSCYWACVVAYTVFLFIPIYDSELDDFEVKVCCSTAIQPCTCGVSRHACYRSIPLSKHRGIRECPCPESIVPHHMHWHACCMQHRVGRLTTTNHNTQSLCTMLEFL